MLASEVMSTRVIKISPDISISTIMRSYYAKDEYQAKLIYVVDGDEKLLGLATAYDIFKFALPDECILEDAYNNTQKQDKSFFCFIDSYNKKLNSKITELMTRDCHFVRTGDHFSNAINLIVKHKITAVPVLNSSEMLVGEITRGAIGHYLTSLTK